MNRALDLPLPFPPDEQQLALMRGVADLGASIASKGSDRFAALDILVDGGLLCKCYCKAALGVYQFTLTPAGQAVLS